MPPRLHNFTAAILEKDGEIYTRHILAESVEEALNAVKFDCARAGEQVIMIGPRNLVDSLDEIAPEFYEGPEEDE